MVLAFKENTDSLILRSAVRVEDLPDPIGPVEALVKRVSSDELCRVYRIAAFGTTDQFIAMVARKMGKLQDGGIANMDAAARIIVKDFLNGKI